MLLIVGVSLKDHARIQSEEGQVALVDFFKVTHQLSLSFNQIG